MRTHTPFCAHSSMQKEPFTQICFSSPSHTISRSSIRIRRRSLSNDRNLQYKSESSSPLQKIFCCPHDRFLTSYHSMEICARPNLKRKNFGLTDNDMLQNVVNTATKTSRFKFSDTKKGRVKNTHPFLRFMGYSKLSFLVSIQLVRK